MVGIILIMILSDLGIILNTIIILLHVLVMRADPGRPRNFGLAAVEVLCMLQLYLLLLIIRKN